ncbi:unnamed protein product [Lepeophtheirus salmonis]|uniref:(salmon louse) hypothetical protein n=1 Tax=Lepeophtheirus salmonis TaxID=72036 RepID=A0A7R8CJH4_LEPSM|nr:unnamed protein product [Lepeophtheirus salmonis]CAF2841422.1 unnamed protein product [Lepeophtheirus salmonis]
MKDGLYKCSFACSSFFRSLIKSVPHEHPLLYLRGVDFNHLESVLSFMYDGEVRVEQKDLDDFLSVAQELKVGGLMDEGTPILIPTPDRNSPDVMIQDKSPSSDSWIPFIEDNENNGSKCADSNSPLIIDMEDGVVSDLDDESDLETVESMHSFTPLASQTGNAEKQNTPVISLQEISTSQNPTVDSETFEISAEANKIIDSELLKCMSNREKDKKYSCLKCPYRSRFKRHVMNHVEARHIVIDSFPARNVISHLRLEDIYPSIRLEHIEGIHPSSLFSTLKEPVLSSHYAKFFSSCSMGSHNKNRKYPSWSKTCRRYALSLW